MNQDKILKMLQEKIDKENILIDEPMKKHTSFKIGGPADYLVIAKTQEEILYVMEVAKEYKIPCTVIGNGSNLLVLDGGIRGIVLKPDLRKIEMEKVDDKVLVTVGAGVPLGFLIQKLLKEEIAGFEFASGIPGTIGGAIYMNAGAHGKEMKDIVNQTTYLNEDGKVCKLSKEEHEFSYRYSKFQKENSIILETVLELDLGNKEKIKEKMQEYASYRKEKQPIEYPSAGSTFKREEDVITAKLIDECGLKGYKIGGAAVSKKHAGFVINKENATAQDVLDLVKYIKQKILEKYGKEIQLEIKVVGEEK